MSLQDCGMYAVFQSTLSMRRATLATNQANQDVQFQSTLSMRRATTALRAAQLGKTVDFNPRSP